MNLSKLLEELRAELKRIEATISALEELARAGAPERGRPKGSKNKPKAPAGK